MIALGSQVFILGSVGRFLYWATFTFVVLQNSYHVFMFAVECANGIFQTILTRINDPKRVAAPSTL